uniref:hypothetical protein n=1 Tax=Escherichia albertii TaxID=208962 RepID=UPI000A853771
WTETTWRQSLRGAGFRNLALCAEVDAINKALEAGANLEGAIMETVGMHGDGFRKAKAACTTCNPLLKIFGIMARAG